MDKFGVGFIAGMVFVWFLHTVLYLATRSIKKDLEKAMKQEKEDARITRC